MNSDFSHPFIAIAGGGLSGSLAAVYFAQMGFKVHVFERRPDMRKEDISAGKSINLAMSARARLALREVGIEQEILDLCVPMYGRLIHKPGQPLELQHYSRDGKEAILSVSRGDLNKKLLTLAESLGVEVHFQCPIVKMDRHTGALTVRPVDGAAAAAEQLLLTPLATVGADGAFSSIRSALVRNDRTDYSQQFLTHGYKELCIPPTDQAVAEGASCPSDKRFRTAFNGLHIWPRGHHMLIALPNQDGSFTVTLFLPFEGGSGGGGGFDGLQTQDQVRKFFEAEFPDAVALLPNLWQDFQDNPTGSLVTVRCFPWSNKAASPSTLVGDACHAVVPFFGQGMNAALQDVTVLAGAVRKHVLNTDASHEELRLGHKKPSVEPAAAVDADKWYAAFRSYERFQKPNADAIADMALENYVEMRDSTANPDFVFRKEIEHKLGSPSLTHRVKEKPRRLSFMSLREGVNRVRKRGSGRHESDEKEAKAVAQTKHPSRPISDILECDMDPKRGPRAFFIRWKEKTIQYESEDAHEITAKINFLLTMHKNNEVVIV